jgi:hypothetical protein
MMDSGAVSESTVKYRVRVGIIRYLELASSECEQRRYEHNLREAAAPGNVPNEVINQWEDWVRGDDFEWYCEPEFSEDENLAIRQFHAVWDQVAELTPEPMPDSIEELIGTPEWNRLVENARDALTVFMRRGHLLELAAL